MKKYNGSCHCKKVTFEVATDLRQVISCNCSHCAMKGLVLTFVPETQFSLKSGETEMTEYLFNKKVIRHLFCTVCGVQPMGRSQNKEGQEMVAINVRCLEGVELEKLTIHPYNGREL